MRAAPVSSGRALPGRPHCPRLAARHRGVVAGLILVDARHEDLVPVLPETFRVRAAELMPDHVERCSNADDAVRKP